MTSSVDRISGRREVEALFEQLGKTLDGRVQVLLIGGAALLDYGLKDSTKDIDVICRSEGARVKLLGSAEELGFELSGPEKRHARLGINRVAMKGRHNLDIFAGKISYDFELSEAMWDRAIKSNTFGMIEMRYTSLEDIFIMKLIANRAGDIEDCAALVSAGLDFGVIYEEIESQYHKASGDDAQKIWITYVEEGIGRLEEDYEMAIPIGDKISALADEHREWLYRGFGSSL